MIQNVLNRRRTLSVADPGFPRGWGTNPQGGGANLLFGQKFPENCMKMKEFVPGGARPWGPPLRSANDFEIGSKIRWPTRRGGAKPITYYFALIPPKAA